MIKNQLNKFFAVIILLLSVGVGNVWADDWEAVWNAWLKCDFNGSPKDFSGSGGYEYQYNPTMTGDANGILYDLGTLDQGNFVITYLSWKIGDNWACSDTYNYMWYTINDGSAIHSSGQHWGGENNTSGYYPKSENIEWVIARYTDASGVYVFKNSFYTHFHWNAQGYRQSDLNNGGYGYKWKYRVAPPAVSSYTVTPTGALAGSGTLEDPYIVAYGGTLQLDLSGASQAHTDANSSAQYSIDNENWGTETANTRKTISNITSTSTANWTVYARYNNSSASLYGATNSKTIYYCAENRYNISATASPAGGGTVTPTSATATGQYSGGNITATPYFGYEFSSWSRTSGGGTFGNSGLAETKFYPTAASTVQASFSRMYAFVEANLQVYNSERNSRTKTGSDWTDASTAIPMEYDGTNHRFYLHTYSTPAELAEQLNSRDAYFYIRTSTSSSSLSGGNKYYANGSGANQSLSAYGTSNKKETKKDDSSNSFKFTGSEDGYVILYFDGTHVWYELECKVTYDGNDKTGGTTPTDATYYAKGATVTVAAEPANWAKIGYSFGGWNTANDGSGNNYAASGSATFTINANTTLHAKWYQTVELDKNGGDEDGSVDVIYNATSTTSLNVAEREGYSVEAYYAEEGCTNKVLTDIGGLVNYSGYVESGKWVHSGETKLYTNWTAHNFTINLANMEADEAGTTSVNVTFDSSTGVEDQIEIPTKNHYDFGGYFVRDEETKELTNIQLIDEEGNWVADVDGYTGASGDDPTWVYADDITLYAKWTEHEYAITIAVTGSGSTSPASSTTAKYVTASGDISAIPASGYSFRDWDFSKTDAVNDIYCADTYTSTSNPVHIHAVHDGTLTANFTPNTYTVSFENLGADAGHKGSLDTTVTFNDTIHMKGRIEVPSKTNYDFGGYYTSVDEGVTLGTQLIDENGNWKKGISGYTGTKEDVASWVYAGHITLYAKWTEIKHDVTVAVSPAGAGSVQVSGSPITKVENIGYETHSSVMTAVPSHPAWKFKEWQETSDVHLDLEHYSRTGTTMEITATADDQTLTAVFEPRFTLVGSKTNNEPGGMPGWDDYDATREFTINSTDPVNLTKECILEASTTYKFEIHDRIDGNFGDGLDGKYELIEGNTAHCANSNKDMLFNTTGAGKYIFKITEFDGSDRAGVQLLWPHQVNFGRRTVDIDGGTHDDDTGGTLSVKAADTTITSGTWHTYNTNVAYNAANNSGYDQKWYGSSDYTGEFTAGGEWNHALISNDNCYAQFIEKPTKVSLENDGHGHVEVADETQTETTCGITTTRSITAVPNTGYLFSSWTKPSGDDFDFSPNDESTTTLTARGGGVQEGQRIYANFTAKTYSVKLNNDHGGVSSDDGSATATYDATSLSVSDHADFTGWNLLGYWNSSAVQVTDENGDLKANVDGYTDADGKWTNDAGETVNLWAHWSRSVTLDDNVSHEHNGSATVTYNSSAGQPTITTTPTRADYAVEGYYTNAACTTKVMEPSGKLLKNVSGYTDSNGKWTKTDATTLYAKWIYVIYRTGDSSGDSHKSVYHESYAGGTIPTEIEFRMQVSQLDTWYSLCIPFEVNAVKVWDEEDGEYYDLVPYYRSDGTFYTGHYVIRTPELTNDSLALANFSAWNDPSSPTGYRPSKNTPYIVQWHHGYFQDRYVSFFGAASQNIPESMKKGERPKTKNWVTVYGNNAMVEGTVEDAYTLNGDEIWERPVDKGESVTIQPFECYIRANSEVTNKYLVLRRGMTFEDEATHFETIDVASPVNAKVLIDGQIYILREGKMYTLQGILVQ